MECCFSVMLLAGFRVLVRTSMDSMFQWVCASAFFLYWIWLIVAFLRQRESSQDDEATEKKSTGYTEIVVLCNIVNSLFYLGFFIYEIWKRRDVPVQSLLLITTWILVTVFTVHSKNRTVKGYRSWPLVLKFWWVCFCILDSFGIGTFLLVRLKWISLPVSVLTPSILNFVSFPCSIALCFSLVSIRNSRKVAELQASLLVKENEDNSRSVFDSAGIWSRLTFQWLNPLFETGRKEKLDISHVPLVPRPESAESSFSVLEDVLRKKKTGGSSLANALVHSIWKPLTINAVLAGINTLSSYLGPFLISNFVNFLSGKDNSWSYGFLLASCFFISKTVESLSQRQWYFGAHRLGIRVRAALMVATYKKSLSIQSSSMSGGKVTNLLNVDIERIGDFCWYIHGIWLLPIQVFLALVILYKSLGVAASLAALLVTLFVMISNIPLAHWQEKLHSKIMEARDRRIKATSETLKSMRILKLHSWEITYLERLLQLRETERNWLKKYLYTCSAIAFLFWASPTLVSVVAFGCCILVKMPLTSGAVLSALATFRILQEPIYNLPELISMMAQTKVSIDRVEEFLREQDQKRLTYIFNPHMSDVAIEIEVGEYAWETSVSSNKPTLMISQNEKIMKGQKVAICGSVGSGKSSLLCSIIGEMPRLNGAGIVVYGSKAYVPQSAWIQTGSVRENVLFGKKMDSVFYEEVLKACALNKDIETWADGDMTVVGERGMNLSGGQKQRIQLARAIYSDSDIFLLDDPFSAVDAHTGAHIFKECLLHLLAEKTVIYVTHQLEFLDSSNHVLVMRDGMIAQSGKYEDLIKDFNSELVRQMAAHKISICQVTPPQGSEFLASTMHQNKESELTEEKPNVISGTSNLSEKINEEERESGRVKWGVYSTFITSAYRGALVPIILLCQIFFQGLQMGSNYWIAWGSQRKGQVTNEQLIGVFILLSGGSSLFILGRAVLLSTVALETSQRLFNCMITCIFRAPIAFFDSTPSSRILNRSSMDQSTVDTDIPYRLAGLAFALIQLLAIIILMSQVAWLVFLLFLVILAISIWYQAYYITTARELARMVGIKKGPILHHFSQSIAGAATIRCFNQQEQFHHKNLEFIDNYSRIAFHNCATMEWLCVRINLLFNIGFFSVLIILVTLPQSSRDPSLAGLAATYGLNLNVLQAWVIWNLCNVENKMISVERILQFSSIQSEAPLVIENCRPPPGWPINGTIEFDNVHVQYSPGLPLVLKGITCTFPEGKKIGVVGRTGSGKSTLIQALFRVVEPSEGRIIIDDVNICRMGLHDLRSRLSIIPQDPTLFQGTVRTNLDPLQQHKDSEIWEALSKCQLLNVVRQDERLLDASVAEDGENWSVGQRQLVCLARVLLKRRRILVLDEATASVDTETDNLIQKTIRAETNDCTVLTVAHRIPTVIDNDLVLVLDEGKILEFDSPAQLLKDQSSAFSKLVMEFLRRSKRHNMSVYS